ncbi:uncharacterized protein ACNLHF_018417 isoform 2-T2 [Anomaloglossus baeobatrachus]
MHGDRDKMVERLLHLTLEILFRLTGEDYTIVKKTSSDRYQDPVSEGWRRPLSPITGPPPHPLIHEDINDQKILELTYKMIELLTGEVPIRCEDVTVYFSMEEWEYLEEHNDQYKDVMMEVPQPLTSPVLSSEKTTTERCPRPLLPEECKQENPDDQGEDLTHINTTETYLRGDEWCKEESPTNDYPVLSSEKTTTERCPRPLLPEECKQENPDDQGEDLTHINSTETYVRGEEWCKEESPTNDYPVLSSERTTPERCHRPLLPQDCKQENPDDQGEDLTHINTTETYVRGDECCKEEIPTHDYPVLSSERTTPERCPHPLLPQDCKQEDPDVPQDDQGEDLTHINTTETYVRGDELCKEKTPTDNRSDECTRSSETHLLFTDVKADNHSIAEDTSKKRIIILCIPTVPHSKNLSSDTFQQLQFADVSQTNQPNKRQRRDDEYQIAQRGEKPGSSSECGKFYSNESSQKNHPKEMPHSCSECGKRFTIKSLLDIHQKTHIDNPYSCSECEELFNQKTTLDAHKKIHLVEKPYSCSECERSFNQKTNLISHQRIHTGEKPFLCTECGKCFMYKSMLRTHEKVHTQDNTFNCSKCEKSFSQKSALDEHQKIHLVENPNICPECGKCFIWKYDLVSHQRIHTGEKPYECTECGKRFTYKSVLQTHLRIHTQEKPYFCSKCGKCFTDKSNFVRHQKIHNGK